MSTTDTREVPVAPSPLGTIPARDQEVAAKGRYHAYVEHHPGAPHVEYAVVVTRGRGGAELGHYAVEDLPLALRIARAIKRGRIGVARELLASRG